MSLGSTSVRNAQDSQLAAQNWGCVPILKTTVFHATKRILYATNVSRSTRSWTATSAQYAGQHSGKPSELKTPPAGVEQAGCGHFCCIQLPCDPWDSTACIYGHPVAATAMMTTSPTESEAGNEHSDMVGVVAAL